MPVKEDLLEILCCPKSMESLKVIDAAVIAKINEQIAAGGVTFENGEALKEPLEEGLVTASHDRIYSVKDSIPIMLVDESLPTAQLGGEVLALLGSG
jgi:uncharacterized protein YbaR (Trm112 family)